MKVQNKGKMLQIKVSLDYGGPIGVIFTEKLFPVRCLWDKLLARHLGVLDD
jgi:hypothetical protein